MALAQHVLSDMNYAEFFYGRSKAGDYVICDNGTAEGEAVSVEDLLGAAKMIKASEIILPDVWKDARGTIEAVRKALKDPGIGYFPSLMAVPQGRDSFEWLFCFLELLRIPEVSVIGLPKVLDKIFPHGMGTYGDPAIVQWPGRVGVTNWVCEILEILDEGATLHLLGIWNDYRELRLYSELAQKHIRSVDTSSPVHCGLLQRAYPNTTSTSKYLEPEEPMDFAIEDITDNQRTLAHLNISILLQAAHAKEVPSETG